MAQGLHFTLFRLFCVMNPWCQTYTYYNIHTWSLHGLRTLTLTVVFLPAKATLTASFTADESQLGFRIVKRTLTLTPCDLKENDQFVRRRGNIFSSVCLSTG